MRDAGGCASQAPLADSQAAVIFGGKSRVFSYPTNFKEQWCPYYKCQD